MFLGVLVYAKGEDVNGKDMQVYFLGKVKVISFILDVVPKPEDDSPILDLESSLNEKAKPATGNYKNMQIIPL